MGAQRSTATLKCTTTGFAFSISIPYFMFSNRGSQQVWAAVDYIEDAIWVTTRCHKDCLKYCHAKTALGEPASSGYGTLRRRWIRFFLKWWKCGGWTLGWISAASGGGVKSREPIREATRTGCGINRFRGDIFSVALQQCMLLFATTRFPTTGRVLFEWV